MLVPVLIPASGMLFSRASQITDLAVQSRLPAIYELRPSYGGDIEDIWRRAATYADRILKGAKTHRTAD